MHYLSQIVGLGNAGKNSGHGRDPKALGAREEPATRLTENHRVEVRQGYIALRVVLHIRRNEYKVQIGRASCRERV